MLVVGIDFRVIELVFDCVLTSKEYIGCMELRHGVC